MTVRIRTRMHQLDLVWVPINETVYSIPSRVPVARGATPSSVFLQTKIGHAASLATRVGKYRSFLAQSTTEREGCGVLWGVPVIAIPTYFPDFDL